MYSAEWDIQKMFRERTNNSNIQIVAKVGSIILRDPFMTDRFMMNIDELVNVQKIITKNKYEFSAISQIKKKNSYLNMFPQESYLDLTIQLSQYDNISYRIVLTNTGRIFCYERLKEHHIDVVDQRRVFRVSSSQSILQQYSEYNIFIDKIRDSVEMSEKGVTCVRFAQTKSLIDENLSEKIINEVQQIENGQSSRNFINRIVNILFDDNYPLQDNLTLIFDSIQQKASYYKPYLEAEIRTTQNTNLIYYEFIEMIRNFHDSVVQGAKKQIRKVAGSRQTFGTNNFRNNCNQYNNYQGLNQYSYNSDLWIVQSKSQKRKKNKQETYQDEGIHFIIKLIILITVLSILRSIGILEFQWEWL